MRTSAVVVAAAALISGAVLAVTAAAAPAERTGCTPGQTTVDGHNAVRFCGPAKATVRVGGKTYALKGGSCLKGAKWLNVNIGTVVFGVVKQKPPYFALLIGQYQGANAGTPGAPKDGTYRGGLVTVRYKGLHWDLFDGATKDVKVTLKKKRTAGTFTGSAQFAARVKVSGSFACS